MPSRRRTSKDTPRKLAGRMKRRWRVVLFGLTCEIAHQIDLFVGERPHLLAVNADYADQFVILEHRHGDEGAGTSEVSERSDRWITFEVRLGHSQIIDVVYLSRSRDSTEAAAGIGTDYHASADVFVGGWDIMKRASTEHLAIIEIERPEFCIT